MREPLQFWESCLRDHGDIVRIHIPFLRVVLLFHPEHIDFVCRHHHKAFVKDILTRRLSLLLGQGLLTSEHEYWRRQRKLAQPFFQTSQVQKLDGLIVAYTERLLSRWRDGEVRDIHAELMRVTLEIIARKLFDLEVDDNAELVAHALEETVDYFMGPWSLLPLARWLPFPATIRFNRALKTLNAFLFEIIHQRRKSGKQGDDMLSYLLALRDEEGQALSDQQLRDELMTLFLAGHETTALSLSYCFYLLGLHPECEARLVAECEEVLAGRSPTAADVPRLTYARGVVMESMRLYPPAWSVGRESIEDVELGGYKIPKGTQFWMAQWVVHRDPRWFPDPLQFKPERWNPEQEETVPRGAYFPFGDGPRVCIGNHFAMLETILILTTVMQRFHLELVEPRALKLLPSATLRPANGIRMRLSERDSKASRMPGFQAKAAALKGTQDAS